MRVGDLYRVALDRPRQVDDRRTGPQIRMRQHRGLDRRLDVGEIGRCDRQERQERRLAVGDQRKPGVGAADVPDQDRELQLRDRIRARCHLRASDVSIHGITRRGAASKPPECARKGMHCGGLHANLRAIGRQSPAATRTTGSTIMRFKWLAAFAALAFIGQAQAQDAATPALVYDLGGKFDKSFNEAAYNGAERFKAETGVEYREFEVQNESQREQALRNFARRGYSPIIAMSFSQQAPLEKVAAEFPDIKFAIVDAVVDMPNVRSIVFREEQGSYLVGMLAAMASKTGKIGFVGGMDIPLIRRFACGYVEGAKAANPDIEIFQNMTGDTGAAWNDPVKGGELAKSQFERGADVVYHAAGGTGMGVLQAAADAGKLGIGVDSNQNHLHPGSVLTSMLKRVDNAVYATFKDAHDGKFTPGVQTLGLAEEGVGWALDDNNKSLITPEMQKAVEEAQAKIVAGEIQVHDYMADNTCPQS
jgi:basic membrane protein A